MELFDPEAVVIDKDPVEVVIPLGEPAVVIDPPEVILTPPAPDVAPARTVACELLN